MQRGRPIKSQIRTNIIEILYFMGEGYAYQIYKVYVDLFPAVTMRSIYYHLKKGTSINEFKIKRIKQESGNYSWGDKAEKIYYTLGPEANPKISPRVKKYFEKRS